MRSSLECVVNISTGDPSKVKELSENCEKSLLDTHSDPDHNRSVFTLFGDNLEKDLKGLCESAFSSIDLAQHTGVHPRFGVVDVVPFVPYQLGQSAYPLDLDDALVARDQFSSFAAEAYSVNVYTYGPDRSLPETRRAIKEGGLPNYKANEANPHRGSICVGARNPLVAYNLIVDTDLVEAKTIAASLRSEEVRTLVFEVRDGIQISANLVAPWMVGPIEFYEMVAAKTTIANSELVGLVPSYCIKQNRRTLETYGLSSSSTIEAQYSSRA